MLYTVRKMIYIICMAIFYNIVIINVGVCLAYNNTNAIEINQDARWISLDLPPEQRMAIDAILNEEYKKIRPMLKNQEIIDISNSTDLYKMVSYMTRMNEVEDQLNDAIMKVLPPAQRNLFEDQMQEKNDITQKATAMLLGLNLTKVQQTQIINMLIRSKSEGWSIIANTSITWEQKVNRLRRKNLAGQIANLLDKNQRATWAAWNGMDNLR